MGGSAGALSFLCPRNPGDLWTILNTRETKNVQRPANPSTTPFLGGVWEVFELFQVRPRHKSHQLTILETDAASRHVKAFLLSRRFVRDPAMPSRPSEGDWALHMWVKTTGPGLTRLADTLHALPSTSLGIRWYTVIPGMKGVNREERPNETNQRRYDLYQRTH